MFLTEWCPFSGNDRQKPKEQNWISSLKFECRVNITLRPHLPANARLRTVQPMTAPLTRTTIRARTDNYAYILLRAC